MFIKIYNFIKFIIKFDFFTFWQVSFNLRGGSAMKKFLLSCLLLLSSTFLSAQSDTFSKDRLETFYDVFITEQSELASQNVNGGSVSLSPAPIAGYLPVVITNTTGLPASEVLVTLAGQQTSANLAQFFFQLQSNALYLPVSASDTTYSPNYSYPLSSFTRCSTGPNDYLAYVPNLAGARFYFSIKQPIYLSSGTLVGSPPNKIVAPTYYAFYDPNYSNLFESVELTFIPEGGGSPPAIPWTASVNTTEVDAFCLPIQIGYYSFDPANPNAVTTMTQDPNALPSGFGVGGLAGATTRGTILTSVVNGLTASDATGQTPKIWPKLAIPFYSDPYAGTGLQTYLRVLSPKQSLGNAASPANTGNLTTQHLPAVQPGPVQFKNYNYPPFPADYLTATTYGNANSFAQNVLSFYTGGTKLYISTGGASSTVYEGVTTGSSPNLLLTMTGVSGTNVGSTATLDQSDINTFQMYSGSQPFIGTPDGTNLGFYFGDAFTVGVLPSSIGTVQANPIDITDASSGGWEATNIGNYYLPANSAITGGPWYDLYAKLFHNVAVRNSSTSFLNNYGLCYAYDFDDSLGISGTITPVITTPDSLNPYLRITLGSVDTVIPDPYSDSNTYTVTFTFVGLSTLQYRQGTTGSWISATSGVPISNLQSNSTNPLYISYTNGQGPTGTHEFIVYLYYQFLVPQGSYNDSEVSIINSTTITPNSATPTAFTINMLP